MIRVHVHLPSLKLTIEILGTNNGVSGCLINVRHRYLNLQSRHGISSPLSYFLTSSTQVDNDLTLNAAYPFARRCLYSYKRILGSQELQTRWEAAELSGGSDRGTRQKASEKTVKTEDGVLGEFHGSTKAFRRPMLERSPSSTSLDRRFNNNQSSARWSTNYVSSVWEYNFKIKIN
ncbi:unnamed protein product [Brassica napus]|uniref:(rape) hypothetical protein n=1 Tax=Brassica napus TaxID=3708 RepID=A0A816VC25_BRANA|nr:unnamed protein product [Brassica napus]